MSFFNYSNIFSKSNLETQPETCNQKRRIPTTVTTETIGTFATAKPNLKPVTFLTCNRVYRLYQYPSIFRPTFPMIFFGRIK